MNIRELRKARQAHLEAQRRKGEELLAQDAAVSERPPIGTKVRLKHDGRVATVVPTGREVPGSEVNVMFDLTGSVMTQPLSNLEIA